MLPTNDPNKQKLSDFVRLEEVPRMLFVGEPHKTPKQVMTELFGATPCPYNSRKNPKDSTLLESYGFGEDATGKDHYHTHIPAPNAKWSFNRHVLIKTPAAKGQNYSFDMVFLNLASYRHGSDIVGKINDVWVDTLGFLKPEGLVAVYGEDVDHLLMVGTYSFRLEQWHFVRVNGGHTLMLGVKRKTTAPNIKGKRLMTQFLNGRPLDDTVPSLSLLPPVNLPYVVRRGTAQAPITISSQFSNWYVADRINQSEVQRPFEEIRKYLANKVEVKKIRIPLSPTVGNLAKLATLADGLIVDKDGHKWAIKGKPEVHFSQEDNEEEGTKVFREVKRLKVTALQLRGDNPGRIITSQLG